MKKFNLFILLGLLFLFSISCANKSPEYTAQKMIEEACMGNAEEFLSYFDKEAVNEDFMKQLIDIVRQENPPEDLTEAFVHEFVYGIAEVAYTPYLEILWVELEKTIRGNSSNYKCNIKIIDDDTVENTLGTNRGNFVLTFTKRDDGWKVTSISVKDLLGDDLLDSTSKTYNTAKNNTISNNKLASTSDTNSASDIVLADNSHFNFRKTTWGISPTRVNASENKQPDYQQSGNPFYSIIYSGKVGGLKADRVYQFIDNKLVQASYVFDEKHLHKNSYIQDYNKIKEILKRKYGKPDTDQAIWTNDLFRNDSSSYGTAISVGHLICQTIWKTKDSEIYLTIKGGNNDIVMTAGYKSIKYSYLIDSRTADAELEGF